MDTRTKKILIGAATTVAMAGIAYVTCKLVLKADDDLWENAEPLPGTDKIEKLIIVKDKKKK